MISGHWCLFLWDSLKESRSFGLIARDLLNASAGTEDNLPYDEPLVNSFSLFTCGKNGTRFSGDSRSGASINVVRRVHCSE